MEYKFCPECDHREPLDGRAYCPVCYDLNGWEIKMETMTEEDQIIMEAERRMDAARLED